MANFVDGKIFDLVMKDIFSFLSLLAKEILRHMASLKTIT